MPFQWTILLGHTKLGAESSFILFSFDTEDGENEYHGEDGEEHAGDGADSEVEPEDFFGAIGEEREESEDG